MEGVEEEMGAIERLPEGCISHVLSLSSPIDTSRSAATSCMFASAAQCDNVWEAFLPHNHREILSRALGSVASDPTTKELYFRLCEPLLIDGGRKSFRLEKSSGKICLMLSARELTIVWGDSPEYWIWTSNPLSRFDEVAQLDLVWWLEITGKIDTATLSHGTTYVAYLVFRFDEHLATGFLNVPQEASISVGSHSSHELVSMFNGELHHQDVFLRSPSAGRIRGVLQWKYPSNVKHVPTTRADGWMELVLGEFFNDQGLDGEVEICCREIKGGIIKRGLILEGIELRPKKN